jgi:peptidoglycan-N-acetylglucosamine deacetylase
MQYDGIDRRQFLNYAVAATMLAAIPRAWGESRVPEIAFTFDDPTTSGGAGLTWPELNERILAALAANNLKSILFVCGKRVDSNAGSQLITTWDRAGHLIGNHSYSHLFFNDSVDADGSKPVTLAEFEADTLKNEPLIRMDALHL